MKPYLFTLCFILFTSLAIAQSLTPQVVSSSGGFFSNTSGMLSFTIGEMTAIETFTSASNILTQGFQQPWDFSTSLPEYIDQDLSFAIYPNPSDGNFNVVTGAEADDKIILKITDMLGKEIFRREFFQQNSLNIIPLNLYDMATGIYMAAITIKEKISGSEKYFFQKLQIIK